MSKVRYRLTIVAARDIRAIQRYSAKQFGADRATRYVENLYATFGTLAESPEIGVLRRFGSSSFQLCPTDEHVVVFERIGHAMAILTVVHRARDIDRLLRELEPTLLEEIDRLRN